ncbi:DUF3531 family protein [Cyanobacterium sp. IPPAS B-1200]|uniref:DUF3531 family protein n=1 Tax=Cyanobacterium sp. IPPAS B-1200 TaxID=1562720 RepID=UPI0008526F71|nr:DUF3531 family protein [Cyanobacterium sp. IPPAS B-1200]OEJ79828.1 hypothetical protein A5482_08860 [Cyanobacterium sp. IPPAS B-1200]
MEVLFREINPFDLWVWIEFETVPKEMERQYIEELFNSWFFLGKLGGYNAENLQVQEVGIDISYMNYDTDYAENSMMSLMHNMGEFEFLGNWGRCWLDLGTSDLVSIDILINSLRELSKDYVTINQLIIGGENSDWPVETNPEDKFMEE